MARRLTYAPEAVADLAAMRRWYGQPGAGASAQRRAKAISAAIKRLRLAPCRHRRGDIPGTRQLVIREHTIVYEAQPDTDDDHTAGDVSVLRVFGPGQDRSGVIR